MPEQEIRLAVVMNGGVSLAVWMAGVSHELDLVRRATTPGAPPSRGHDDKVAELWRRLLQPKAERHRRLVIDVVAGASAGGLNGAMLANAVAHNGTLDPAPPNRDDIDHVIPPTAKGPWLREVWCHLGGLRQGHLLPPTPQTDTGSFLDGAFFEDNLKRVMVRLSAPAGEPVPPGNPHHPVTLFTTASGLGVQKYSAQDAAGQAFDVSDHRFLYRFTTDKLPKYDATQLKFQSERQICCDFARPDLLAIAARASASFPVAFHPQLEPEALNDVPRRLRPQDASATTSWLMDGGVLDNAPFGPVLDTIAKGSVAGDVRRFVVYVVPSVGMSTNSSRTDASAGEAPKWHSIVNSAIQYPREVDFRSDVEELQRLHEEAETSWSDPQTLYDQAMADPAVNRKILEAATRLQPTYTLGRAAGAIWETRMVGNAGRVTSLDQKNAAAPIEDASRILEPGLPWTPPIDHPIVTLTSNGTPPEAEWIWGLGPAERVVRTVLRSFRRRLTAQDPSTTDPMVGDLRDGLTALSETLRNILALRAVVERHLKEEYGELASSGVEDVADLIAKVFHDLHVRKALGKEIVALQRRFLDGEQLFTTALAVEVVSRCTSSRTPDQRSAPFSFVRLGPDASLPVLSPEDQTLAKHLGNRILYGTQVGHFGSFGADKWRRWDWLMGRLHAASHLGMLLQDSSQSDQQDALAWISEVQTAILAAEGVTLKEVHDTLNDLQTDFHDASWNIGLARMLDAMNDADRDRADGERSTRHLGDRAVAVVSGLGATTESDGVIKRKEPGIWLEALVGRSSAEKSTLWQRLARWYLAPTRETVWQRLTGEPVTPDPVTGARWLLRPGLWGAVLCAGPPLIVGGLAASNAGAPLAGLLMGCLAGACVLVGVGGLVLVTRLRRWRDGLNGQFIKKVNEWLPAAPSRSADALQMPGGDSASGQQVAEPDQGQRAPKDTTPTAARRPKMSPTPT